MRRKGSRNPKKAPEQGYMDSPNLSNMTNKESISDYDPETKTNEKSVRQEDFQAPIDSYNNTEKSLEMEDNYNSHLENETQVEENQGTEESNGKGKSKDFINSNEQSWNTVEPEIENDTVQGTAQSPSNDYDDNVQNVNDSQTNSEDKEANAEHQNTEQLQDNNEEPNFESEYVQGSEQQINYEERSTTPEIRPPTRRSISIEETKSQEKSNKKRITLRRSPPPTKGKNDQVKRFSSQENSDIEQENNKGKKITLKRRTIEDKLEDSSEMEIQDNDNLYSSKEHIEQRRLSNTTEEKSQDSEGKKLLSVF